MRRENESTWNRPFLVALVGFFSLFLAITLFFIFPLFFEPFDVSKGRIGIIMGAHSLMAILTRPLFGRLIDLRGRKKISLFGIGLLIVILPFFHLIKDAGLLPVFLRAMTGIAWGISMTATITICSDLAPVDKMAKSMGIIGVAGLLSVALGPLAGEEIVNKFGFTGLFNTSLVFLIISFVFILTTKEMLRLPNGNDRKQNRFPLKGLGLFSVVVIGLLPVFHGSVRGSVVYFIALFAHSIPLDRVGPFFVSFSAAAICARLFLGDLSDRHGRKRVVLPSILIISLNLFLLAQVHSLGLLILSGFVGGLGQGLLFPALSTYVIDICGRENKGFALSLYLTFFDIGMGLGTPFFGWISDFWGYRVMYMAGGALFLLVGLLFGWKAPAPGNNQT